MPPDTDLEDDQITDDAESEDGDVTVEEVKEEGQHEEEGAADGDADSEDDADQLVISLDGEEEVDDGASQSLVRDLRTELREKAKELKLLRRQITAPPAPQTLGPAPTMEACGFDEAKFQAETLTWMQKKVKAESEQAEEQTKIVRAQENWKRHVDSVNTEDARRKLADVSEARESFETTLSELQQCMVLDAPADPKVAATLRYVLGKNPAEAKKLAAIENPTRFIWALAQLEKKVKTTRKNAPPAPETRVRQGTHGGGAGGAVDNQLARLQAEAAKTGNYTKVTAYHANKRKAA